VTTIGQDASATVLDPNWLVQDTCSGTLVRVASGKVRVDDFVTHRRFVLRAPHSYLAHG
jgi:hypothetical protein